MASTPIQPGIDVHVVVMPIPLRPAITVAGIVGHTATGQLEVPLRCRHTPGMAPVHPQPTAPGSTPAGRMLRIALHRLYQRYTVVAWSVTSHVAPRRHAARGYREHSGLFTDTDLQLFGLPPDWQGARRIGDASGVTSKGVVTKKATEKAASSMLTLVHVSPEGGVLDVARYRHVRSQRELRSELASSVRRERPAGAESRWTPVDLPVDGALRRFLLLSEAERWIAHGEVDGADLVLRGYRFPVQRVELVRLHAVDAYLE